MMIQNCSINKRLLHIPALLHFLQRWFGLCLVCCLFVMSAAAYAAPQDPIVMLQGISNNMLTQLAQKKSAIRRNPDVLQHIITQTLLPYMDLNNMSQQVVGPRYWRSASQSEQEAFKQEFTRFVTRTYSTAFASYTNEKILFYPVRGGTSGKSSIQVYSRIVRSSGPVIPVSYRLLSRADTWKIDDFSVEGISMVQSYRSQFADILAQQGLSGLIQRLKQQNQRH